MARKRFDAPEPTDSFAEWRSRHPKATLRDAWNGALAACHARLAVACYDRCAGAPGVLAGLASPPKPVGTSVTWDE